MPDDILAIVGAYSSVRGLVCAGGSSLVTLTLPIIYHSTSAARCHANYGRVLLVNHCLLA